VQIELLFSNFDISLNLTNNFPEFLFILPVGISFYTFQSMSYTIDVYKGNLKPTQSVMKFFAYLSMFPQLVAGPIVRASTLMPQLESIKPTNEQERWNGLKLIALGYFKKVFIADNLAPFVNTGFADIHQTTSTIYWWGIMLGFAFQIYCDFSGYTDIARGIAKWMGIHFRVNFNHPYRAISMRDFWQRWHISLSTWFRDYVYIPLGGSKKGKFRSHLNMWITMVVSGFWHGASWNFIMWGWLHALFTSIERIIKWPGFLKAHKLSWVAIILVMVQSTVAWVFFRAATFNDALVIIRNMLWVNTNVDFKIPQDVRNGFYFVLIMFVIEYIFVSIKLRKLIRNKKLYRTIEVILVALLITITIFLRGKGHEFIYFQF
jgi:D-alanyl-lipoteichoic acid acyltransferase DltB (MBOAT superfamily)